MKKTFVPKWFALARSRRTLALGHHLVLVVAVAIVPLLAFAGWIVHDVGREQRRGVEYGLRTTAQALAIAVEREILATQRTLEILAASEVLRHDDLHAFHAEAQRMTRIHDMWYVVALTDARGQMLLSSLRPFGTPLPDIGDRDYIRQIVERGRPTVSDLIAGRVTGAKNVTIAVPVTRDGVLRYILFAGLNVEAIGRILNAENIPSDWISAVADTHQILIARNRDPQRFIGRELISPLAQAVRAAPEGVGRFPVYDSPDAYSVWYRVPSLGWTVTLGAPVTFVDAPLKRSLWRIMMVGIVVAVAGGGIALVWAQRISASMAALVSAAGRLGRGEAVTSPSSPVAEVEAVGHAIRAAGATIAERTEELIASQRRLKRLVESSLIGILIGEGDRIVDANDALLRTIGRTRADLREGRVSWFVAPLSKPSETESVRPDGTRVPILVGSVFLDEARQAWASFVLDITEHKRAEDERRRRAEAEAASRAKDQFLAMVSHELRTPLSAVLSSVSALRTGRLTGVDVAPALERIERNTRLQGRLIDDLLDLSRILAGKLHIRREEIVVEPIVSDAVAALSHTADVKGVALVEKLSEPTHRVLGDPERLQQIALNLIENAIKYTPSGGRIVVSLAHVGSKTVLSVRDTGRGIEPHLLAHIFDRFQQGPDAGRHGGLGLGLAIVRSLVEAQGGTVRAESSGPGRGSIFTVELPSIPVPLVVSSAAC